MNSNLSVIRQEGLKVLTKKLGVAGTAVFIRQFENGNGNYTKERDNLLKDISIDDIAASIKKRKNNESPRKKRI
ncbi:MAG: hypothetical protein FWD47_15615 [Treponema sp.]|nr:hypothetical protein [Treponema sp.]